ncbi:hypothetical protein [Nocardia wallacei]|uniref:hypothetical protein n=1 Tax=Nocardia wallacei TaxID=480035 RepID=UPI001E2EE26D|nr:hypothetical protein [Nocardia wallacei]
MGVLNSSLDRVPGGWSSSRDVRFAALRANPDRLVQIVEGPVEAADDGRVLIDVEPVVEGLVHQSAGVVAGIVVHRVRIGQDVERLPQGLGADTELSAGAGKPCFSGHSVGLDPPEPSFDLRLWDRSVSCQVE